MEELRKADEALNDTSAAHPEAAHPEVCSTPLTVVLGEDVVQ